MEQGYRHEYKFLISEASARLLRLRLPGVMARDAYAGSTGQYKIRSLYFDDFSRSAYADKMAGVRDRTKYRIRYYNDVPDFLKLERKEKLGDLTRKLAQSISREEALALAQCRSEARQGLAGELCRGTREKGLRPVVLVDYDRTPFVCRDGNTRITLDEKVRTRPFCSDLFASSEAMIPVLEPGQVILEVKFDDFIPGYLLSALGDIPKDRLAVSKFALCMDLI